MIKQRMDTRRSSRFPSNTESEISSFLMKFSSLAALKGVILTARHARKYHQNGDIFVSVNTTLNQRHFKMDFVARASIFTHEMSSKSENIQWDTKRHVYQTNCQRFPNWSTVISTSLYFHYVGPLPSNRLPKEISLFHVMKSKLSSIAPSWQYNNICKWLFSCDFNNHCKASFNVICTVCGAI